MRQDLCEYKQIYPEATTWKPTNFFFSLSRMMNRLDLFIYYFGSFFVYGNGERLRRRDRRQRIFSLLILAIFFLFF